MNDPPSIATLLEARSALTGGVTLGVHMTSQWPKATGTVLSRPADNRVALVDYQAAEDRSVLSQPFRSPPKPSRRPHQMPVAKF